ncbi:EAL domain-containing protein (putative c-di-GMP-specific phosphodiesterase class I) [Paraburkholderia sp. RAU2J]|uniref:EAL domain-containing protein n=1 Tax=Paraburkholderia sp. RAU2J TaxID=1938810 RepID=UPI000EABF96C|nr:EAL domain-containing protein [Paraburkholderia sp. RAU2J]RKT10711.1 EAL domain-containing protein (putative c-di-GMP-specific phosphodiesterase class I) [Paraburkholderia sp. RAU2J]
MRPVYESSFRMTKFVFVMLFLLAALEPSAHASTSPDVASGDVGNRIAAFAQGLSEIITRAPVARLQFGTVCTLPAIMPTPATLAGPVAGPIGQAEARQLRCISVLAPLEIGVGELVSTVDANVTPETSVALSPSIVPQTGVPFSIPTSVPAPVFAAVADAAPSGEKLHVSLNCGQDHACAERAAPVQPNRTFTSEPSSEASSSLAVDPQAVLFGAKVLTGLALLALMALGCWALYRWRFTPQARLVRAAQRGLLRGEFGLEYQPMIDLRRGKCVGIEALLRWDNLEFGLRGPMHYMRRLENSKVIGPLTRFMLATAASEVAALGAAKSLCVALQVSGVYMAADNLVSDVQDSAKGILPRLILEVTESDCADSTPRVLESVAALRKQGVQFALAGAGLSPLKFGLLRKFDFELIKMDRQVLALDGYDRTSSLATMTEIARDLGALLVAEGVDSAAHHEALYKARTNLGQGFFYSRALPIRRLAAFLESGGPSRLAVRTQRRRDAKGGSWLHRHSPT